MRFGDRRLVACASLLVTLSAPAHGGPRAAIHQQRYAMGTMFDIVVFHHARAEATHAVEGAFAEIDRLERVLSHYRSDSDLSKLNREA